MEEEVLVTPEKLEFRYRYIDLLGEGANGKTYRARNLQTGQIVAIKALKLSQSENFKAFDLFRREAEVLESVHIQGVPTFYESIVSEDAGGECYIVQEFIESPAIQTYLDEGRKFNETETLCLLLRVCEILKALHTVYTPPIIHRDIKPSNILCEMPEEGIDRRTNLTPYLIDFGAVANPQTKSGSSTIAGTYGYMAPEQMLGDCAIQSDFYSLGATALHMLTGKPPYEINTADVFQLDYQDTIKEYAPDTSENMIKLIGLMLQRNTTDRPQNAQELMDKINLVLDGYDPDYQQEEAPPAEENKTFLQKLVKKLQGDGNNFTPNSRWITVPGVLRAYSMQSTRCAEYTFRSKKRWLTKERLWAGLYPLDMLPAEQQKLYQLPLPCTVQYNPDNPRLNVLVSIDVSKAKLAVRS